MAEFQNLPWATLVLLTLLGLIMGSFVGVLAMRLPGGRSVIFSRSRCDHCGAPLTPWQLVPLLGFALQKGHCIKCGSRLSIDYLVFELAGAAVAIWAGLWMAGPVLWITMGYGWLLLALALMDFRTFCLNRGLIWLLLFGGLAANWYLDNRHFGDHIFGAAVGWSSLVLIGWAYRGVRHRTGLGAGDPRLFGAIGAWARWDGLPSVILIGCVAALSFVVILSIAGRTLRLETKLPFGSFLCLGAWIVWLYGPLVG